MDLLADQSKLGLDHRHSESATCSTKGLGLMAISFKLTIESASFKQSAISLRLYHSSEYWAPCFYVNLVMGVGGGVKEKHNDCLLNKYLI